jgi:hypothetical protein
MKPRMSAEAEGKVVAYSPSQQPANTVKKLSENDK